MTKNDPRFPVLSALGAVGVAVVRNGYERAVAAADAVVEKVIAVVGTAPPR